MGISVLFLTLKSDNVIQVCLFIKLEMCVYDLKKKNLKRDRCHSCGGLEYNAKECKLAPQPEKCHFCQSINHKVALNLLKACKLPDQRESQPILGGRSRNPQPCHHAPRGPGLSCSGWGISFL